MREAWQAWKYATRFAFWTLIESLTAAISANKKAMRELTAFNPANPKELFAAGYAIFFYDLSWDNWQGCWREPNAPPHLAVYPEFTVYAFGDWKSIPWHRVTFKELEYDKREFRAVPLSYARRNLKFGDNILRAA